MLPRPKDLSNSIFHGWLLYLQSPEVRRGRVHRAQRKEKAGVSRSGIQAKKSDKRE